MVYYQVSIILIIVKEIAPPKILIDSYIMERDEVLFRIYFLLKQNFSTALLQPVIVEINADFLHNQKVQNKD